MTDSREKNEKKIFRRGVEKAPGQMFGMGLASNSGVALLMALIITVVVFLMVASTLYLVTQSTKISGPHMAYDTACRAADGAIELSKDAIEKTFSHDPLPGGTNLFSTAFTSCLGTNVYINNAPCTELNFTMPASMGGTYKATISVTRTAAKMMTGGSIEFPPKAFGKNIAIFFKISTTVTGANSLSCEDAVVYRHI